MIFIYMVPQGGGSAGANRDFNYRIPPGWDPAGEANYSFRAWHTDLRQWIILTDLQPAQQAAAIISRLQGTARELTRNMTSDEIMHGGE